MTNHVLSMAALAGVAACLIGCRAPAPGDPTEVSEGWAGPVRVTDTSQRQTVVVAREVLGQWFRMDPEASGPSLLVTQPHEYTAQGDQRLSHALVPRPVTMRRIGRIRLDSRGGLLHLWVQVARQRLDTADHQMVSQQRASDAPTQTPIESGQGVAPPQRDIWTDAGRDRQLEGRILAALRERLVGPAPTTTMTSQTPPPGE